MEIISKETIMMKISKILDERYSINEKPTLIKVTQHEMDELNEINKLSKGQNCDSVFGVPVQLIDT